MAYVPGVNDQTYPTLSDVCKRLDPDGSIARIAELLNQINPILDDAVFLEGNLPTGHRTTVRADIPKGTWRKLNYGVRPTKSHTAQVTDTVGMLETYSEIDKDLAMLNGNTAEFRLSEDTPHLEGLSQQMAETMFYGDTAANPERFLGLSPRYNELGNPANKPDAQTYGDHVIDAAGTAGFTSTWLVCWGPSSVHMIYPKGSMAGLQHRDLGEQTLFDDDGGRFQGYRTHYQWKAGMVVRDWRYVVRIANQDPTEAFDPVPYITAIHTLPSLNVGRCVFYCNRAILTQMDIAAQAKNNVYLTLGNDHFGRPLTNFWGIPVKSTDQLLLTETVLT